jgi:4-amino-4-deoxy-L-arabinose transferase-like glycosyltransferase
MAGRRMPTVEQTDATGETGGWLLAAPGRRLVLVGLFLAITLSLYVDRMTFLHEEPRRAIVAQEMLLSGDYVGPTVFQRPYFRKPPLHNWLIALSALPEGAVSHRGARTVSLAAFLLLGVAVYRLLRPVSRRRAAVAALVTLTAYLMACEYANRAEPDMLLGLLGFLTYAVYIRRPDHLPHLLLSSLLMGLGILTKGVSPLFFYPGLLVWILLGGGPRGRRLAGLGLHLLLSLALPVLWAGLLAARGDLGQLLATGVYEVGTKTGGAIGQFLGHLVVFPLRIVLILLPWSLLPLLAFRRGRRAGTIYGSSFWIAAVSILIFTLASGSRDRYILPAIPFIAIVLAEHIDPRRWVPHRPGRVLLLLLAAACLAGAVAGVVLRYPLPAICLAATAVATALLALRGRYRVIDYALIVALVVLSGYEHGIYYHRAERKGTYAPLVAAIDAATRPELPLVIDQQVRMIHLAFYLQAGLQRPVYAAAVADFERYYYITRADRARTGDPVLARLTYPRPKIGEIVLQEVGRPSAAAALPTAR